MIDVPPRRRRPHLALLAVPFVWQVGALPWVNDVAWRPFGLPFGLVWQMAGIVVASATIAWVRAIDLRRERAGR